MKKGNAVCSGSVLKTGKKAKFVVHAAGDVGISGDGYRWRKYGQKMVKGNPNPRCLLTSQYFFLKVLLFYLFKPLLNVYGCSGMLLLCIRVIIVILCYGGLLLQHVCAMGPSRFTTLSSFH